MGFTPEVGCWQLGGNTSHRSEPNGQEGDRVGFALVEGEALNVPNQAETAAANSGSVVVHPS